MKKGKRLKIPGPKHYHHVEAQEAVEQYHAIALKRVKEQAKMVIENLFAEMERHTDVYSYLEVVGDKVRNKYYKYLGIPQNEQQRTINDLTEEDGPTETEVDRRRGIHLEMQPFCSGEDLPLISPARTDPSENPGEVPLII